MTMARRTLVVVGGLLFAFFFLLFVAGAVQPAPPPPPRRHRAPDTPDPSLLPDRVFFFSGGSWLGVSLADIDSERAKELKLKEEAGAEVKAVMPESPAAEAGLKEEDVILKYQGTRVEGVAQLTRLVRETPAGRTVDVEIVRAGAPRTVRVKVTEREDEHGGPGRRFFHRRIEIPPIDIPDIDIPDIPDFESAFSSARLGATVEDLTDQLGDFFGVEDGEGVLVRAVSKGSPGEAAGLRAGDVIVKVGEEKVSDASDLRSALRERRGKEIVLGIVRNRKEETLRVAPSKAQRSSSEDEEEEGTPAGDEDVMRWVPRGPEPPMVLRIETGRNRVIIPPVV
jgi:serine protease Do